MCQRAYEAYYQAYTHDLSPPLQGAEFERAMQLLAAACWRRRIAPELVLTAAWDYCHRRGRLVTPAYLLRTVKAFAAAAESLVSVSDEEDRGQLERDVAMFLRFSSQRSVSEALEAYASSDVGPRADVLYFMALRLSQGDVAAAHLPQTLWELRISPKRERLWKQFLSH